MSFWRRNIDRKGRILRATLGVLLVVAGLVLATYQLWVGIVLVTSGGFVLFEAVRGWCLMRACGIKTKY